VLHGVAATAGELTKNHRHQDAMEETGCDFIPLMVKTFGVWLSFALHMLQTIAYHTTAPSIKPARLHFFNSFLCLCAPIMMACMI